MKKNLCIELTRQRIKKIAVSIALILAFQGIAQIPTASLIAYYPFCGNANDVSGNGLNGTVMGAALSSDRFGNANSAYAFNGSSDYIDLPPTSFVGLNIYSYSIWIRPTSTAVSLAYCVGGNDPYCQSLSFNSTAVSAGSYNVGSNPVQSYVFSNTLAGINTWIHVVVTRDASDLKMYVNGVLLVTNTGNTNGQSADYGSTPPYKAVIGTRSTLQTYFFDGQIDDVRIYSSVLSQNDVNALYAETPGALSVNSGSICLGSSFTLTPTGAASYTYSGGSPIVTPSATTTYTVSGILNIGCQASAGVSTVSVNPLPVIAISGSSLICKGQADILSVGGAVNYTWSTGSTTTSITAIPLITTTFSVAGSNSAGCSSSASFSLIVEICEGVAQQQTDEYVFSAYPNPNSGSFTVKLKATDKRDCQFMLADMQGRVLRSVELNTDENFIDFSSEAAPGYYIGKLFMKGQFISAQKIIMR